jgi:hypothetical protein
MTGSSMLALPRSDTRSRQMSAGSSHPARLAALAEDGYLATVGTSVEVAPAQAGDLRDAQAGAVQQSQQDAIGVAGLAASRVWTSASSRMGSASVSFLGRSLSAAPTLSRRKPHALPERQQRLHRGQRTDAGGRRTVQAVGVGLQIHERDDAQRSGDESATWTPNRRGPYRSQICWPAASECAPRDVESRGPGMGARKRGPGREALGSGPQPTTAKNLFSAAWRQDDTIISVTSPVSSMGSDLEMRQARTVGFAGSSRLTRTQ